MVEICHELISDFKRCGKILETAGLKTFKLLPHLWELTGFMTVGVTSFFVVHAENI